MAWQIVSEVLDMPVTGELTSEMKFTALVYANYAKPDGSDSYPSTETVSRLTGYHERSVQRYRARLELLGVLVRDGIGRGGTKKYKVVTSGGGVTVSPPIDAARTGKDARPAAKAQAAAVVMFESEIGKASPLIRGEIEKAVTAYSELWVIDAITEAALCGVPNLKYILAILERWKTEGKGTTKKAGKDAKRAGYDRVASVLRTDPEKIAEINRRRKDKQSREDKLDIIDRALGGA